MAKGIIEVSPRNARSGLKGETISRRAVLRGAVAVGVSLIIPSILSGCDAGSKGANSTGSAPAGSRSSSPDSAAPTNAPKVPKQSVQYQTQPKGDQKCGNCANFVAESNTCKLVEGDISPEGWCALWSKKT